MLATSATTFWQAAYNSGVNSLPNFQASVLTSMFPRSCVVEIKNKDTVSRDTQFGLSISASSQAVSLEYKQKDGWSVDVTTEMKLPISAWIYIYSCFSLSVLIQNLLSFSFFFFLTLSRSNTSFCLPWKEDIRGNHETKILSDLKEESLHTQTLKHSKFLIIKKILRRTNREKQEWIRKRCLETR